MPRTRSWCVRPHVEFLETRLELSATVPVNSIGTALGDVREPKAINYDAKALMQNMPPLTANVPLTLVMNLLPADQAHYPTPRNSGGATSKRDVTIIGRTIPGSIVLEDNSNGYYKWDGPAFATDAKGFFSVPAKLTQGVNTFNFLVVDPFSRQLIRSYPIFWLPFAAPHSKLK
jgi:hypothetical protein